MAKRIFQAVLFCLGLSILYGEVSISYHIINACKQGLGESGCFGLSGLEYLVVLAVALVFIALFIVYWTLYHQVTFKTVLFLVAFVVFWLLVSVVPMSIVGKIQSAALHDGVIFGMDFRNVYYEYARHQSTIHSLVDCDVFIQGKDGCKTQFILKNNLGIENCDAIDSDRKYACRYGVMEKGGFQKLSADVCMETFNESNSAALNYLTHCITKLAKLQSDINVCKALVGVRPDRSSDYYYNRCVQNFQ